MAATTNLAEALTTIKGNLCVISGTLEENPQPRIYCPLINAYKAEVNILSEDRPQVGPKVQGRKKERERGQGHDFKLLK